MAGVGEGVGEKKLVETTVVMMTVVVGVTDSIGVELVRVASLGVGETTSESVVAELSNGSNRLAVVTTKLNEGKEADMLTLGADVATLVMTVARDEVDTRLVLAAMDSLTDGDAVVITVVVTEGVLDISIIIGVNVCIEVTAMGVVGVTMSTTGLVSVKGSNEMSSPEPIPDPTSVGRGVTDNTGVVLLMPCNVTAIDDVITIGVIVGVCSISGVLINIPEILEICEVVRASENVAEMVGSGVIPVVTATVDGFSVKATVGVDVTTIDVGSATTVVVSAKEGRRKLSLSV